jgi:hypothetical protein
VGRIRLESSAPISGTTNPAASVFVPSNADLTPTGSPTVVEGYLGKAYSFNGSSQYHLVQMQTVEVLLD